MAEESRASAGKNGDGGNGAERADGERKGTETKGAVKALVPVDVLGSGATAADRDSVLGGGVSVDAEERGYNGSGSIEVGGELCEEWVEADALLGQKADTIMMKV